MQFQQITLIMLISINVGVSTISINMHYCEYDAKTVHRLQATKIAAFRSEISEAVLVCYPAWDAGYYSETDEFAMRLSTVQRSRCIVDRGSKREGRCLIGLISHLKCPSRPLQKDILGKIIDRVNHEERPKCLSELTLSPKTLSRGAWCTENTTNPQRRFAANSCHYN